MQLRVEKLCFRYRSSSPVFKNINFEIGPGMTSIIGPNAAGKSTLLKCLCGVLKPEGFVYLDEKNIHSYKPKEILNTISYLPQDSLTNSILTVFEATLLGNMESLSWKIRDEHYSAVMNTLKLFGIDHLAMKPLNELSGGQKQMVSIAQVFIRNPKILLMDEPSNSLDLQKQLELFETIREITRKNKTTTLVVLHDLNLAARYSDKVMLVNEGKIEAFGKPYQVITEDMIRTVYGVFSNVITDAENIPQVIPKGSVRSRNL